MKKPIIFSLFVILCVLVGCERREIAQPPLCKINLDLDASDRWTECVKPFAQKAKQLVTQPKVAAYLNYLAADLQKIANAPEQVLGEELAGEVKGLKNAMGLEMLEHSLFLALFTEASCTSSVVEGNDESIWLARNLDFSSMFAPFLIRVEFNKDGKKVCEGVSFAGYPGILTGMNDKIAIAYNQRPTNKAQPPASLAINMAIKNLSETDDNNKTKFLPWELRKLLVRGMDFDRAFAELKGIKNSSSSAYLILAGAKAKEGAIISRENDKIESVDQLSADNKFISKTNSDQCSSCGRCRSMTSSLNKMSDGDIETALFNALENEPVNVRHQGFFTLHSTVMCPKKGLIKSKFYADPYSSN